MANDKLPAIRPLIPTLNELVESVEKKEVAFKNDRYKTYLNQSPPKQWLKEHPIATKEITDASGRKVDVPVQFLPIDKVEILLDTIFQEWKVEVKEVIQLFHSIAVTVRVHYKVQGTDNWYFHDGVGAVKVQTSKNSSPADLSNIKANAVQIGLPAAKSYAIKDACEHIGRLFGRDINRADTLPFEGKYEAPDSSKKEDVQISEFERLKLLLEGAKNRVELLKYKKNCLTPEALELYDELWKKLK